MSGAVLAAPVPVFDAATHTSRLSNGLDVPHVTAVLSAVGVSTNFEDLAQLSPRLEERIREACARGAAVHADCHAYDDDDLAWETVDERVRPYVEAWAAFRRAKGLVPVARERYVYHPMYQYAGIVDGVFGLRRAKRRLRVLVDIKTGDPEDAAAHLQTAAYAEAFLVGHPGESIDERWAVRLVPARRVPYRIVNYTAPARTTARLDFATFLACLTTYNAQPGRRKAA